jgi:hypothetical protein
VTGAPASRRPVGRRPNRLSPELLADLSDWTLHLHTRSFTQVSVDMLLRDLRRTAPSTLGYTLVLAVAPGLPEVSITVADTRLRAEQVLSRLTFDLPVAHELRARATFYAARAGALDDLAVLLRDSTVFGAGPVEVGGTPGTDVVPGVRGLDDHTRVNYAVGVLLGRGETVERARHHLHRLAERHGSLQAAAAQVLDTFDA